MKLYVHKHPREGCISEVREVPDDSAQAIAPLEEMSRDEYEAWKAAQPAFPIVLSPEQIWFQKPNGTITDGPTGIEIAASENVRNLLTGQLAMVTAAIGAGAITAAAPQDIWDVHGTKHTLPAGELIALLLRHGIAWAAMFAEFAP